MSPRRSRDICYTSEQRDAYVMPRNLLALPGPPAWLDFLELDDFLRAIEAYFESVEEPTLAENRFERGPIEHAAMRALREQRLDQCSGLAAGLAPDDMVPRTQELPQIECISLPEDRHGCAGSRGCLSMAA